jgi:hypothetical protein
MGGDRRERNAAADVDGDVEPEPEVLASPLQDSFLRLGEVAKQAQVDGVYAVSAADGVRREVLPEGLAPLAMLGEPVARPGFLQGEGRGRSLPSISG